MNFASLSERRETLFASGLDRQKGHVCGEGAGRQESGMRLEMRLVAMIGLVMDFFAY